MRLTLKRRRGKNTNPRIIPSYEVLVGENLSQTLNVWQIYLHGWSISVENVGKYTTPIECLGSEPYPTGWVHFPCTRTNFGPLPTV